MDLIKFNYNLPEEKIAKYPPIKRGGSNLMFIDRASGKIEDRKYSDMVDYLDSGDVLVINNTKVEKVRVFLKNERNEKKIEALFLNKVFRGSDSEEAWECILARAKNVKEEDTLVSLSGENILRVEKRTSGETYLVTFERGDSESLFQNEGHVPLPPYMKREDEKDDYVRYNTVYAKKDGSAAAPTAGLNVTEELLKDLEEKEVKVVEVSLEVGWGTFAPIRTDVIEEHIIHSERIHVSNEAANTINNALNNCNKVWALGTTAARTLESVAVDGRVKEYTGETDIYIYPGYNWKIVDGLITNFHAPKSSLIVMISSFMGYDLTMKAYKKALEGEYKFLSYGDTMLIK